MPYQLGSASPVHGAGKLYIAYDIVPVKASSTYATNEFNNRAGARRERGDPTPAVEIIQSREAFAYVGFACYERLTRRSPTRGIPDWKFQSFRGNWNHRLANSNCWKVSLSPELDEMIPIIV